MNHFNIDDILNEIDRHFSVLSDEDLDANLRLAGIDDYAVDEEEICLTFAISHNGFLCDIPMHFEKISNADVYVASYKLAA